MKLFVFFKGGPYHGSAVRVDLPDTTTIKKILRIHGHEYAFISNPSTEACLRFGIGVSTLGVCLEHLGPA